MDNNITRTSNLSVGCYVHNYRSIGAGAITSAVLACMVLPSHKRLCQPTEAQREVFLYSDLILEFVNVKKQLKAPFVAYADFECILKS